MPAQIQDATFLDARLKHLGFQGEDNVEAMKRVLLTEMKGVCQIIESAPTPTHVSNMTKEGYGQILTCVLCQPNITSQLPQMFSLKCTVTGCRNALEKQMPQDKIRLFGGKSMNTPSQP